MFHTLLLFYSLFAFMQTSYNKSKQLLSTCMNVFAKKHVIHTPPQNQLDMDACSGVQSLWDSLITENYRNFRNFIFANKQNEYNGIRDKVPPKHVCTDADAKGPGVFERLCDSMSYGIRGALELINDNLFGLIVGSSAGGLENKKDGILASTDETEHLPAPTPKPVKQKIKSSSQLLIKTQSPVQKTVPIRLTKFSQLLSTSTFSQQKNKSNFPSPIQQRVKSIIKSSPQLLTTKLSVQQIIKSGTGIKLQLSELQLFLTVPSSPTQQKINSIVKSPPQLLVITISSPVQQKIISIDINLLLSAPPQQIKSIFNFFVFLLSSTLPSTSLSQQLLLTAPTQSTEFQQKVKSIFKSPLLLLLPASAQQKAELAVIRSLSVLLSTSPTSILPQQSIFIKTTFPSSQPLLLLTAPQQKNVKSNINGSNPSWNFKPIPNSANLENNTVPPPVQILTNSSIGYKPATKSMINSYLYEIIKKRSSEVPSTVYQKDKQIRQIISNVINKPNGNPPFKKPNVLEPKTLFKTPIVPKLFIPRDVTSLYYFSVTFKNLENGNNSAQAGTTTTVDTNLLIGRTSEFEIQKSSKSKSKLKSRSLPAPTISSHSYQQPVFGSLSKQIKTKKKELRVRTRLRIIEREERNEIIKDEKDEPVDMILDEVIDPPLSPPKKQISKSKSVKFKFNTKYDGDEQVISVSKVLKKETKRKKRKERKEREKEREEIIKSSQLYKDLKLLTNDTSDQYRGPVEHFFKETIQTLITKIDIINNTNLETILYLNENCFKIEELRNHTSYDQDPVNYHCIFRDVVHCISKEIIRIIRCTYLNVIVPLINSQDGTFRMDDNSHFLSVILDQKIIITNEQIEPILKTISNVNDVGLSIPVYNSIVNTKHRLKDLPILSLLMIRYPLVPDGDLVNYNLLF